MKPYAIQAGPGEVSLQEFSMEDYLDACAFWRDTPGVGLSISDQPDAIAAFLARNPGLSFVARHGRALAGTVLCGHDGRRGYLYHAAVEPLYRRTGLGRRLVAASMRGLAEAGIVRCHLMVYADNAQGLEFWRRLGAFERADLDIYSFDTGVPTGQL
jgi:ribosomal protein S18 acetylase RimI-like enzyme